MPLFLETKHREDENAPPTCELSLNQFKSEKPPDWLRLNRFGLDKAKRVKPKPNPLLIPKADTNC